MISQAYFPPRSVSFCLLPPIPKALLRESSGKLSESSRKALGKLSESSAAPSLASTTNDSCSGCPLPYPTAAWADDCLATAADSSPLVTLASYIQRHFGAV